MDRVKILQTISQNKSKSIPLPIPLDIQEEKSRSLDRFKESLIQVGGVFFEIKGENELNTFIEKHFPDATNFIKKETWEKYPLECPNKKLANLKTIIIEGQFGVAENGAIWIDDSNSPNRLVPFVCEELIICIDTNKIFGDMHEAYDKLRNNKAGFGVFISGPSKTADIEQNLVLGAQASKKLIVFLID